MEQFAAGELAPAAEHRALINARRSKCQRDSQHDAIFLLPALTRIGHILRWFEGKKLWAAVAALVAFLLFAAACFVVPWEYRVSAKGKLMPSVRHEVFAPWDSYVDEILVEPGQTVAAGERLIQLESDELQ